MILTVLKHAYIIPYQNPFYADNKVDQYFLHAIWFIKEKGVLL